MIEKQHIRDEEKNESLMIKQTKCCPVICLSENLFVPRQKKIAVGQGSVIYFFFH